MKIEVLSQFPEVRPERRTALDLSIRVVADDAPQEPQRAALCVMFVVDVSASMGGSPLAGVKESIEVITSMLDDRDRVGIISFARDARIECAPSPLDKAHRQVVSVTARRLDNRVGTNIEAALRLATASIEENREDGERVVVLLLSDGEPSVGERDVDALASMTHALHAYGACSVLGFGKHHDTEVLSRIAEAGKGTFHYIFDPSCCTFEYTRALGAQRELAITNLEILVELGEGVEVCSVDGAIEQRHVRAGLKLQMPDVTHGSSVIALLGVIFQPTPERGPASIAAITATSRTPYQANEVSSAPIDVVIGVVQFPCGADVRVRADRLLFDVREERRRLRSIIGGGRYSDALVVLDGMLGRTRALLEGLVGVEDCARTHALELLEESLEDERMIVAEGARERHREYSRYHERNTSYTVNVSTSSRVSGDIEVGDGVLRLIFIDGPRTRQIVELGEHTVLGRGASCDLVLEGEGISRRHADIMFVDDDIILRDLGSTNGVWCNGELLEGAKVLTGADTICIGLHRFRVVR